MRWSSCVGIATSSNISKGVAILKSSNSFLSLEQTGSCSKKKKKINIINPPSNKLYIWCNPFKQVKFSQQISNPDQSGGWEMIPVLPKNTFPLGDVGFGCSCSAVTTRSIVIKLIKRAHEIRRSAAVDARELINLYLILRGLANAISQIPSKVS